MTDSTKGKMRNKLYKCVLTSNIRQIPESTEYLRCKSKKILGNMFHQCFKFKNSMYWGYHKVIIYEMEISDFPEVKTMNVKCS